MFIIKGILRSAGRRHRRIPHISLRKTLPCRVWISCFLVLIHDRLQKPSLASCRHMTCQAAAWPSLGQGLSFPTCHDRYLKPGSSEALIVNRCTFVKSQALSYGRLVWENHVLFLKHRYDNRKSRHFSLPLHASLILVGTPVLLGEVAGKDKVLFR